jgi:hypothetical protein
VSAIQLLLTESLGKPPQAEEVPAPRLPASAERVKRLGWEDLLALGAALELHEIEGVIDHGGPEALRTRLNRLTDEQRSTLREALAERVLA